MEQWRKNVYFLWVAILIASACWSMVMPFIPVFLAEELGVTQGVAAWAGVLGAANSLGMVVMAPVWGAVGDRMGRKMMMMRAGFVLTITYLMMSLVTSPQQLLGVRVMIGMLTGFIPTAMALVGTTTPQEHVGRALALVSTAGPTGMILGPMLGGALADLFGIRGTMIVGSLLIGIATTLVLFFVKEQFTPAKREPGGNFWSDMGEVLRHKAFAALVVTTMLSMASIAALEPVLIPFLKELLGAGAPNWQAGALYSLPGIAFIVAASWWARGGERWGYGTTITIGLSLGALMVIPQALAVTHWDFAAFRLSQGVFMASVNPGIAAAVALVVPQALRGRAFGLNQSAVAAGTMIGPLLGGFVGTLLGTRWVFVLSALLLLCAATWTWRVVTPRVNLIRNQSA